MKTISIVLLGLLFLTGCADMRQRVGVVLRSAGEGMQAANNARAQTVWCSSQVIGDQIYTTCR